MLFFEGICFADNIKFIGQGVQNFIGESQAGLQGGEMAIGIKEFIDCPYDVCTGLSETVAGSVAANALFSCGSLVMRGVDDMVADRAVDGYRIMLVGRRVAAKLQIDIVAACKELSGISGIAHSASYGAGRAAAHKGEIRGKHFAKIAMEFRGGIKAKIHPILPGGIVEITPEALIFNGRQINAAAALQLCAAMLAATGVHMHEMDSIVCHQAVDTGVTNQAQCIFLISFFEIGVAIAKTLRCVLGEIERLSGLNIDKTHVIKLSAVIFPGCGRFAGGAEGDMRAAVLHDMTHLLSGIIAVNQADGMVII